MANLKVNMSKTKNPMPEQDPVVRAGNFDEVALGYDADTAMKEAARCLDCKNSPCREGCPVAVKIPRFLEKVREGDFEAAYEIVTSTNSLPAVCGRVCPQEKQCESKCVRGLKGESVGIGRLERFVAEFKILVYDGVKAIQSASIFPCVHHRIYLSSAMQELVEHVGTQEPHGPVMSTLPKSPVDASSTNSGVLCARTRCISDSGWPFCG